MRRTTRSRRRRRSPKRGARAAAPKGVGVPAPGARARSVPARAAAGGSAGAGAETGTGGIEAEAGTGETRIVGLVRGEVAEGVEAGNLGVPRAAVVAIDVGAGADQSARAQPRGARGGVKRSAAAARVAVQGARRRIARFRRSPCLSRRRSRDSLPTLRRLLCLRRRQLQRAPMANGPGRSRNGTRRALADFLTGWLTWHRRSRGPRRGWTLGASRS